MPMKTKNLDMVRCSSIDGSTLCVCGADDRQLMQLYRRRLQNGVIHASWAQHCLATVEAFAGHGDAPRLYRPKAPQPSVAKVGADGTAILRGSSPAGRSQRRPRFAGLRRPSLRGRARPPAKLADAENAGIGVGQRQRTSPVTAPRFGGSQGPPPRPSRRRCRHGMPNSWKVK